MALTELIEPGKIVNIINAVAGVAAGPTFALPARTCVLTWQTAFDVAPGAANITLRVSLDGTVWTVLDTSTAVGGEVRTVAAPTSAPLVSANVVTNTGNKTVTVSLMAKVAVP